MKCLKTDAKKFYREMGKQPIEIEEPLSIKEIERFWKKSRAIKKNTMKKLNVLKETKKELKRLINKNGKTSN